MGARAYLIREVKPDKFIAVYGHWTADRIYDIAYNGVSKEELYNKLCKMWEELKENEEKSQNPFIYEFNNIVDVYKFIDLSLIHI